MPPDPILEVKGLRVELSTRSGTVPVLDDLSFSIDAGETLAFVGESGCGKSMTALAVMGLVPHPIGRIASGSIRLAGEDLTRVPEKRMRAVRGNDVSMIFQEPMTALNPVYTAGEQIAESLRRHQDMGRRAAWEHAIEMLAAVGIPDPRGRASAYPHQMSGGQRQRVMIAMALACRPKVLIADEPTTALDVTVQAQIFELLKDLRRETGTALILITHDMGVVAEMAERMIVMYAGRKVEDGMVTDVIAEPKHPYTRGLISCVPHLAEVLTEERPDLTEVPGVVPPLTQFGRDMCLFSSRCPLADDKCWEERPPERRFGAGHVAACWHAEEVS
ncbi:ABC transporter ATP-binding protein [uncultured Paracoccus sp.]|uniref:ABC transporter ATP-binding protein n=1 Tax=uncultured Paracoccus sp. TaxID=189685 RepID=UPI0026344ECF|nr:ABC transporter ATP-binding protein [uncultured Paracoccus sp.]